MTFPWRDVYWENLFFLVLTHLLGILGILYCMLMQFSWATAVTALVWFMCCALSISSGYHRLFAHRAYRCAAIVRVFYLLFGAASFQQSVLQWASDHRNHHANTDEEGDPYNIKKGFWWAHWGWLCFRSPPRDHRNVRDLMADPLVRFQDRHYLSLALFFGLLLPTLVASVWRDAAGGLLVVGFLRLLLQYHATFSINSVAHSIGRQPYSTSTSARDSMLASILTMGEGYHNYHHRFPSDYRNGVRAHHFDLSKWWIWLLSCIGLARNLKRTPEEAILTAMKGVVQR